MDSRKSSLQSPEKDNVRLNSQEDLAVPMTFKEPAMLRNLSNRSAPDKNTPRRWALLLLNVQNDFFRNGSISVPNVSNQYVEQLNDVCVSVEWSMVMLAVTQHPANHHSFSSTVPASKPFLQSTLKSGDEVVLLPDHCVQGMHGADVRPNLLRTSHEVVVETGLSPELDDVGVFVSMGVHSMESIAKGHLQRAKITDVVIAGLDIDGESILSALDTLLDLGIRGHVINELCHLRFKAEEMWDVCHDMGAEILTVDELAEICHPDPVTLPNFRLDVFEKLLEIANNKQRSLEDFKAYMQETKCSAELTLPHPASGLRFMHYLAKTSTLAAAEILTFLLDEGHANINAISEIDELSPIMVACKHGCYSAVEAMLSNQTQSPDINLERADCYGRTAVMYAIQRRSIEIVTLLMEHPNGGKGLLHAQDIAQRSVLLIACQYAGLDDSNPMQRSQTRGLDVLKYLWHTFSGREFVDQAGDSANWTLWNYLIKYDLDDYLKKAIEAHVAFVPTDSESTTLAAELAQAEVLNRDPATTLKRTVRLNNVTASVLTRNQTVEHPMLNRKQSRTSMIDFKRSRKASLYDGMTDNTRQRGKTIPRDQLFGQCISGGVNFLHQATWQKKRSVCSTLLKHFKEEGMLNEPTENGLSALDLCADDVDPTWPFLLVKRGCAPKQKTGLAMYHLCFKAILAGEPDVIRTVALSDEYGITIDSHLLETLGRAKFAKTCTSSFSSAAMPLTQLSFSCEQCEESRPNTLYCSMCAFQCHRTHKGVVCEGTASFHCGDATGTCHCRKGFKILDAPYDNFLVDEPLPPSNKGGALTMRRMSQHVPEMKFVIDDAMTRQGSTKLRREGSTLSSVVPENSSPHMSAAKLAGEVTTPRNADEMSIALPSPRYAMGNGLKTSRFVRVRTFRKMGTNGTDRAEEIVSAAQRKLQTELQMLSYRDYVRHVFLMSASKRGQDALIEELVKWVNPEVAIDETLDRPLHVAARVGKVHTCLLLKGNGARPNVANFAGETPLHVAAMHGHDAVCSVLAHNSNILKMDALALTPLHHAVRNNHPQVVHTLSDFLRHKSKVPVDINMLYFGPEKQRKSVTRFAHALTRKVSMMSGNAVDTKCVAKEILQLENGECEGHASPLHLAVRYGNVRCIEILMKNGASPMHVDATEFNPYQTAIWEQYTSHQRLKHHQESINNSLHASGGKSKQQKIRFFDGQRLTDQGEDVEARIEDMNRDLPDHMKTLGLKTTHDLVDVMGAAPEVDSTRKSFAYRHLFKWIIGYVFILSIFLAVSVPVNSQRYYLTRMIEENFDRSGFFNVTTLDEAMDWMGDNLLDADTLLTPPVEVDNRTRPALGLQLLGAVRIRQTRSRPSICSLPSYATGMGDLSCMESSPSPSYEDKRQLTWNPTLPGGVPAGIANMIQSARNYRRGEGITEHLDFGSYSPNGYFVDLDLQANSRDFNGQLLDILFSSSDDGELWMDEYTRLVAVEFSLYNLNYDMFASVILSVESGPSGEVVENLHVLSYALQNEWYQPYPSDGFKIAVLLVFVFMCSGVLSVWIRFGTRRILRKRGPWFDGALALFAMALFSLDFTVSWKVEELNIDFSQTSSYQSLRRIMTLLENQTFVVSCCILLMWLRLIKYSVLLPRFGRVTFAFLNTMKNFEVYSYLIFMFFVVTGFICTYRTAFGQTLRTSTYSGSFDLLMQMMMGEWSESVFGQLPDLMRSVAFISFMIIVAVVFINLFISVLSEVYPREKQRAVIQCNDNLTALIQRDYIMDTHPIMQASTGKAEHWRTFLRVNVVLPVLNGVSLLVRLRHKSWNFDNPRKEFGWEKGRAFFRANLLEENEMLVR